MVGKMLCSILFLSLAIPFWPQSRMIIVDKRHLQLYVIENADTLLSVPVCVGANYGDKVKKGDLRTPEGSFSISQIQNSAKWTHDFNDGKGLVIGAYGPYFIRLRIPKWSNSIGIHGTCFPESIGSRASEGCIRLKNEDLIQLRKYIRIGMDVIILPD